MEMVGFNGSGCETGEKRRCDGTGEELPKAPQLIHAADGLVHDASLLPAALISADTVGLIACDERGYGGEGELKASVEEAFRDDHPDDKGGERDVAHRQAGRSTRTARNMMRIMKKDRIVALAPPEMRR